MFTAKFNYVVERLTILALCLWGNWALYYWVAVLVFDASYITLKAYLPVLLIQIALTAFFLLRTDLGFSRGSDYIFASAKPTPRFSSNRAFFAYGVVVMLVSVAVVVLADHFGWTYSALSYNLLWAFLLPCSLAYLGYFPAAKGPVSEATATKYSRWDTLDCLVFLLCVTALAVKAYGSGVVSWDDAFYGHVMSSTLANPGLPVQGQDLLLNTSAPYTLHPSYRGVGYEVLIALLSEALVIDPLHLYLDIFPVLTAILWSLSIYLFVRALRVPYPGLAVVATFLVMMFWGSAKGFAPGNLLLNLWWGKNQVLQMAAPLLFFAVAAYMQRQSFRTWLLLLFCVCTIAIRSSTALFVVPLAVGMAALVFTPSIRNNLRTLLATFAALAPIFLLLAYGLMVIRAAPIGGERFVGQLAVHGQEFGGLPAKSAVLAILICLPLLVRTIKDALLQTYMLRLCLLGIFTVMAPFFIETIAVVTGLNLLSFRLPAAYPAVLMVGVLASVAMFQLLEKESALSMRGGKYWVSVLALSLYVTLIVAMERRYIYDWYIWTKPLSDSQWQEAEQVRALIPDDAYVAAGHLDFFLPILPNPPSFVWVRHYLNYHEYFISPEEFSDRKYLHRTLAKRLANRGNSVEQTVDQILSIAHKLGVTTLVFQAQPDWRGTEFDPANKEFVSALTARATRSGYKCETTPSSKMRVCNRQL